MNNILKESIFNQIKNGDLLKHNHGDTKCNKMCGGRQCYQIGDDIIRVNHSTHDVDITTNLYSCSIVEQPIIFTNGVSVS